MKPSLIDRIIKRNTSIVRRDFSDWKLAQLSAQSVSNPRQVLLQTLYTDVMQDALMSSQIDTLRIGKSKAADFDLVDSNGNTDEQATEQFKASGLYEQFAGHIVESLFYGFTVAEITGGKVRTVPRSYIEPTEGVFYPDQYGHSGIRYRNLREYGRTILEFYPKEGALGYINKAVPYVLIKKFALSCWSEFCEIFGMPPRILKTNTQDSEMLTRAESMMREIGSAAYAIIDTTEDINFGQSVSTDGTIYEKLISKCDGQISLINLAAVLGQDTVNGNYSKEESSSKLLDDVVASDKKLIESYFNTTILPALAHNGMVKDGLRLRISKSKDIEALWNKTVQAMPYFNIEPKWIKDTFGIEVTDPKVASLSAPPSCPPPMSEGISDFFA